MKKVLLGAIAGVFILFFVIPMCAIFFMVAFKIMFPSPEEKAEYQKQIAIQEATAEKINKEKAIIEERQKSHRAEEMQKSLLVARACVYSQDAVKQKLKSPGSAKFPDCAFDADQYEIRANENKTMFSVIGYVDAQNSFGALLRSKYVVIMKKEGNQFEVVNVALGNP